jgi:hypothetical protein
MRRTSAALLTLAAFLSTLAFVWTGQAREGAATRPSPAPTRPAASPTPQTPPVAAAPAPTRDLFVYGEGEDAQRPGSTRDGATSAAPSTAAATPTPEPTPAPRARLVGFLRTSSGVSAVLALDGAVEVARVREERRGYRLLAVDEEAATARLRTPEGEEVELSAPLPAPASGADEAARP